MLERQLFLKSLSAEKMSLVGAFQNRDHQAKVFFCILLDGSRCRITQFFFVPEVIYVVIMRQLMSWTLGLHEDFFQLTFIRKLSKKVIFYKF